MTGEPGSFATLRADLAAALGTWRRAPWLPAISALFASVGAGQTVEAGADGEVAGGDAAAGLIVLVVSVVGLGWLGTERVVYRRLFTGDADPARELGATTRRHILPFLRLGLLLALPAGVPVVLAGVATDGDATAVALASALITLGAFVLLTFAPAELALRSPRAGAALQRSVALIRTHWPHVAAHVTLPALVRAVLAGLGQLAPGGQAGLWTVVVTSGVVAAGLNGAIVHRWLALDAAEAGQPGAPSSG